MAKAKTSAPGKRKPQKGAAAERKASRPAPQPAPATKAERFKWDAAYCAEVEKRGVQGLSAVEIRRELGIPAATWRLWIQTHPDFAESVEEADDAARAEMEKLGRVGVKMGPGFNATAYIFLMKNRWPKLYRDRQDHQITGANDGPVVTELRVPDLANAADNREALKEFEQFRRSLVSSAPALGETKH